MKTVRKRVNLSLSPAQYDLLSRLAKVQKKSRAAVLEGMFDEMAPILERVVVIGEAHAKASEHAQASIRQSAERAEAQVLPLAQEALSQFDLLLGNVQGSAAAPAPKPTPGAGAGAATQGKRKGKGRVYPPPRALVAALKRPGKRKRARR